jgi:hypothetical protein
MGTYRLHRDCHTANVFLVEVVVSVGRGNRLASFRPTLLTVECSSYSATSILLDTGAFKNVGIWGICLLIDISPSPMEIDDAERWPGVLEECRGASRRRPPNSNPGKKIVGRRT